MEGVNIGAILLGYFGVLVVGITSLVALGLLIAHRTKGAQITFAAGLLVTAGIAALATLSFLQKGMGFFVEGSEPMIVVTTLALLLAGAGQFVAALQSSRTYAGALGCAAGSVVLVAAPLLDPPDYANVRILNLAGVSLLRPGVGLLLAVASLMIAVLPPGRKTIAFLWTAQAVLGGIVGFAFGDTVVGTRTSVLPSPPGGARVMVEVYVLGKQVSGETGIVDTREPSSVRVLSVTQAAWVYGPPAAGATAGVLAALSIARLLAKQSAEGVHAGPLVGAERPARTWLFGIWRMRLPAPIGGLGQAKVQVLNVETVVLPGDAGTVRLCVLSRLRAAGW